MQVPLVGPRCEKFSDIGTFNSESRSSEESPMKEAGRCCTDFLLIGSLPKGLRFRVSRNNDYVVL